MQELKKIDKQTNVLTWFEIPVTNMERAQDFYETILDIKMTTPLSQDNNEDVMFFPCNPNVIQSTSGRVTGALIKSATHNPSDNGTLVYINAYPDIQLVLDKVQQTGERIIVPKTECHAGFYAIIIDTEGNRVGLHAEK